MLGISRLALRQALEALEYGRLEEAHRLLSQPVTQGVRGRAGLLGQLARAFADRGERQLRKDNVEAAWRDLLQAEQLHTAEPACDRLRQALTRLGLAEARALLQAGEPGRAEEAIGHLRQRQVASPELQVLETVARGWLESRAQADLGEFARATTTIDRVRRLLLAPLPRLDEFRADLERRERDYAPLPVRLHEAADANRWGEALELAGQVLRVAPNHAEARKVRARAWKAIEPATLALRGPASQPEAESPPEPASPRFLLWIDGVGGYLLCLGNRVTLGQAGPDARVDVPLIADVSRLHATISRDAEGYLLEAARPVQVNGLAAARILLRPNDRVTLGSSCQFQFLLPAPVSSSARLDLVSGHRLPYGVDSILLMADTLLLGPSAQNHVQVPDLAQQLVLFRHRDGLGLRSGGTLVVNGQPSSERTLLPARAVVSGPELGLAIEPVEPQT